MKRIACFFLFMGFICSSHAGDCPDGPYPSYWQHETNTPPEGSRAFKLSQNYPKTLKTEANQPWLQHNPFDPDLTLEQRNEQSGLYLEAALQYVLEGNTNSESREDDFDVCKNQVRNWYHVPWMHWSASKGRDYRHGLTRELEPAIQKLHSNQENLENAWAIGFYNEIGAYTIGQLFPGGHINDVKVPTEHVMFEEGTVVSKVIFTSATEASVPYLKGAPQWIANVTAPECKRKTVETPDMEPKHLDCERKLTEMNLLQVDIAIVDTRAPYRWVFGTFVYNGSGEKNGWQALDPVGLQWGNDHLLAGKTYEEVKAHQPELRGTTDPALVKQSSMLIAEANDGVNWLKKDMGCSGRLNGPVDNPRSSCMSCHATAAVPIVLAPGESNSCAKGKLDTYRIVRPPLADFSDQCTDDAVDKIWFRNITGGAPFGHATICDGVSWVSLDYSLQLKDALTGYLEETKPTQSEELSIRTFFNKLMGEPEVRRLEESRETRGGIDNN